MRSSAARSLAQLPPLATPAAVRRADRRRRAGDPFGHVAREIVEAERRSRRRGATPTVSGPVAPRAHGPVARPHAARRQTAPVSPHG